MRHRYLALALLGFAACGSSETPAIEQSGETGGTPASPSTPTTEAPAQLPIVETPPVAGIQPQPGGEGQRCEENEAEGGHPISNEA